MRLGRRIRRRVIRLIITAIIMTAAGNMKLSAGTFNAMAGAMNHFSVGAYFGQDCVGAETGYTMFGSGPLDVGIDVRTDFKNVVSSTIFGIGRFGPLFVGFGGGSRMTNGDPDFDLMLKGGLRIWLFDLTIREDWFFDGWKSKPESLFTAAVRINIV